MINRKVEQLARLWFDRWVAGMAHYIPLSPEQIEHARPGKMRMFRIQARLKLEMQREKRR